MSRADHEVLLTIDLDLGTGILAVDHLIAHLHTHGHLLAAVQYAALTNCLYLAPLGLLLGGVGNDDPAAGLLLFVFVGFHQNTVMKWSNLHTLIPPPKDLLALSPFECQFRFPNLSISPTICKGWRQDFFRFFCKKNEL